jgi:hypothetical protein
LSGFALSHAYDPRFAKEMTFSQFMRNDRCQTAPTKSQEEHRESRGGIRTLWLDYVGRAGIVALALPIPAADHAKYDLFFVLLLAPATVAAGAGLRLSGLPARLAQICGEVSYPSTSFTCRS